MKLLELLSWGDNKLMLRLGVAGLLSGVGSAALLGLVNTAAEEISDNGLDQVDWLLAGAFVAIAVTYFFAEIFLLRHVGRHVEISIDKSRKKLLGQIAVADYAQLETFGQAKLFESITQSSQQISYNSPLIGMCFRSVLLLFAVMAYVFWLSSLAFFLIIAVIGVGSVVYLRMGKTLGGWFHKLGQTEAVMFGKIADLFRGIKEIRMWSKRSDALYASFVPASLEKVACGEEVHKQMSRQMIFGMSAFYILLAVIVFVVPVYSDSFGTDVAKISTAVLFMIGPITVVVQSVSVLSMIEQAAARMIDLSVELEAIREPIDDINTSNLPETFREIVFDGVEFIYPNRDPKHGFVLGPLNLKVTAGEILFVTGANGAGKSTLIKLLTGLYRPDRGKISIDDTVLGNRSIAPYRNLIATVFSDFHLFSELFGVTDIDPEEAEYWLNRFEIAHVTGIKDGKFVNVDLSSGQRKRLGLISAILEKRPIIVLDEWAADQDPYFRKKFYREILPELKSRGTTVIAVTHDDHYFDVADRRMHLETGKLDEASLADTGGV
jgi:putative ATP-binding cassette transporter